MMKLLKNRKIAILITIVVIIFATLFGVGRSLNRLSREAEALFYDGIFLENTGQPQRSIEHHLRVLEQASLDISSIFAIHPPLSDESEALMMARRELIDANSIPEKYSAYKNVQKASAAFLRKAENDDLTEDDREPIEQYQTTFSGVVSAIQRSEYNERAIGFMDEASIIAKFLKPFAFVTSPQTFGT